MLQNSLRTRRIVILGAGPIGLEAAAAFAGRYSVTVLERADVAGNVQDWGHVQLFTPFEMNAGPCGAAVLHAAGSKLPDASDHLSGRQFRAQYLLPLAAALQNTTIRIRANVISVGRTRLMKGDAIGKSERAHDAFRVLYEQDGVEHVIECDVVLDCAGTYGNPNWMGQGGTAALGERAQRSAIIYRIPDVLGADRQRFAGKRILLVGGGHSAATTALRLGELSRAEPGGSFVWITRADASHAVEPVHDDTLPARASLTNSANELAASMPPGSVWLGAADILEIANGGRNAAGRRFTVALRSSSGAVRNEAFDEIVAQVGYEPDDSHYRQLQIHECYASRGPMKLAAALLGASGAGGADCLSLGGFGAQALINPEPNYFILGAKSYGKNSAFLMRAGYEQLADVSSLLTAAQ